MGDEPFTTAAASARVEALPTGSGCLTFQRSSDGLSNMTQMPAAWIRRLQCASCEAFSFKIVEDGEVWMIECNHCGALVAAAEDQAGKKTHANGTWVKERVL